MTTPKELNSEDIARLIDVSTVRTPHGEAEKTLGEVVHDHPFLVQAQSRLAGGQVQADAGQQSVA